MNIITYLSILQVIGGNVCRLLLLHYSLCEMTTLLRCDLWINIFFTPMISGGRVGIEGGFTFTLKVKLQVGLDMFFLALSIVEGDLSVTLL
jgi:hypothetical protein